MDIMISLYWSVRAELSTTGWQKISDRRIAQDSRARRQNTAQEGDKINIVM